jgi:hypothetical protein
MVLLTKPRRMPLLSHQPHGRICARAPKVRTMKLAGCQERGSLPAALVSGVLVFVHCPAQKRLVTPGVITATFRSFGCGRREPARGVNPDYARYSETAAHARNIRLRLSEAATSDLASSQPHDRFRFPTLVTGTLNHVETIRATVSSRAWAHRRIPLLLILLCAFWRPLPFRCAHLPTVLERSIGTLCNATLGDLVPAYHRPQVNTFVQSNFTVAVDKLLKINADPPPAFDRPNASSRPASPRYHIIRSDHVTRRPAYSGHNRYWVDPD